MNCAIPRAPAELMANGLKFDSAYNCADSSAAPTFHRCATREIIGANRAGTNDGTADRPSPRGEPNPTDRDPAERTKP